MPAHFYVSLAHKSVSASDTTLSEKKESPILKEIVKARSSFVARVHPAFADSRFSIVRASRSRARRSHYQYKTGMHSVATSRDCAPRCHTSNTAFQPRPLNKGSNRQALFQKLFNHKKTPATCGCRSMKTMTLLFNSTTSSIEVEQGDRLNNSSPANLNF